MQDVQEMAVRDWAHLLELWDGLRRPAGTYVFRGQRDATWGLTTSLHRALTDFGIPPANAERTEVGLVCRFRRQAHHFVGGLTPDRGKVIEWLALMQHFGAPTRVQDWTYSLFVAAFFALETAGGQSAVWVVRRDLLLSSAARKLPRAFADGLLRDGYSDDAASFTELFARNPSVPLVCPVNPYRLNERLSIQQGLFLVPGDIALSFEENLSASLRGADPDGRVQKLVLPGTLAFRSEALSWLHGVNINASTLFPGLDGFARSLRTMLAVDSIIPSPKSWSVELSG